MLIMRPSSANTLSFLQPLLPLHRVSGVFPRVNQSISSNRRRFPNFPSTSEGKDGEGPQSPSTPPVKRGRGRPKGSGNKSSTGRAASGRGRGAGRGTARNNKRQVLVKDASLRSMGNSGRGGNRTLPGTAKDTTTEAGEQRRETVRLGDKLGDVASTFPDRSIDTDRQQQLERMKRQTRELFADNVADTNRKGSKSSKLKRTSRKNLMINNGASVAKDDAVRRVMERVDKLTEGRYCKTRTAREDAGEEIDGKKKGDQAEEDEREITEDCISKQRAERVLADRSLRHVMVVFGKHLIRDQVTIEYASRIRWLVRGIKSGRLKPDLVCFTGGQWRDNHVADAAAGFIFFRHLCEHQNVDISDLRFIVESQSTCTKEAMTNVVRELEVLESEELNAGAEDSASRRRVSPSLRYHFTLISNDYHLYRMDVVHRLSPVVSLLAPLEQLGASWGYEEVPYPHQCCDDEGKRFQSEVHKTLEELIPLQVNIQAVANREEFFQEENFASLGSVRRKLNDFIRQLHSSRGPLALHMHMVDMQRAAEQGRRGKKGTSPAGRVANMRLDEALEWAAGALGKIEEIIEPAAKRRDCVSLKAWAMVAALIEKAVLQGRKACELCPRPATA